MHVASPAHAVCCDTIGVHLPPVSVTHTHSEPMHATCSSQYIAVPLPLSCSSSHGDASEATAIDNAMTAKTACTRRSTGRVGKQPQRTRASPPPASLADPAFSLRPGGGR